MLSQFRAVSTVAVGATIRLADCFGEQHDRPASVTSNGVSCSCVLDDSTAKAICGVPSSHFSEKKLVSPDEVYTFVVIGDGVSGRAAAQTLRSLSRPGSSVHVVGSPGLAVDIDTESATISLRDGRRIGFERCLLACGVPHVAVSEGNNFIDADARHYVHALRGSKTRRDFIAAARRGDPVCVVGGSWYAVELAAAAADEARLKGLKGDKEYGSCLHSRFSPMTNQPTIPSPFCLLLALFMQFQE
jgi:hypothetical protein